MRRVGFLFLLATLATGLPVPVMAANQEQSPASDESSFEDLASDYYAHLVAKRYNDASATVARIKAEAAVPQVAKAISDLLGAPVAAALKRDDKARRLLADGMTGLSSAPEAIGMVIPAFLIVERPDFAGATIDRLTGRAPDLVRDLPVEWVYASLRKTGEPAAIVNQRTVALAQIGYGGSQGDALTADAIGILLKRRDVTGATDLIRYLDAPRQLESLLIDRRYAALWDRLAEQAGPQLAKGRTASVAAAQQAHTAKPEGAQELAELIDSYRYAKRYDDAFLLRGKLASSPAQLAKADEQTGWAVNNMALALHEAGRADEADALFASLNNAVREHWRISMFINRAELLVTDGKFAQALPLIGEAQKVDKSAYAEQLLRRLRYCALARLGRSADAPALRGEMMGHAKDARSATIDGLICAGEVNVAEQLALDAVKDEDFHEAFLRALQAKPLTADDPSVWGGWAALRQRPAIAAAFSRLGRDLPDTLRAPPLK